MQTDLLRIRLPAELKETLRKRAAEDGRSMNGQLVQILKLHLGAEDFAPGDTLKQEAA